MASFSGFWSSFMSTYKNINSSTLTGAIDIIVVEQEDGTLLGTPFHVRFGKLGVLQNQRSKVYITINGRSVDDLNMELGEAGQGVFLVEPTDTISSSPNDYLEPSNENSLAGSDQALAMTPTDNQRITNELHQGKISIQEAPNNGKNAETHFTESNDQPLSNARHRTKRSVIHTMGQESSDDDQEVNDSASINKRASRARKRETLTGVSIQENKHKPTSTHSYREIQSQPISSSRRRSASETEPSVFQLDDDDDAQSHSSTTFVDAHSRINSIDSRQKSLLHVNKNINSVENEADSDSSSEDQSLTDQQIPVKTTRTLSNPIPIEQVNKPAPMTPLDESNPMSNPLLSQSAPIPMRIDSNIPSPMRGVISPTDVVGSDYFPLESLPNPTTLRPESPKSDTEYELDKSLQQAAMKKKERPGWRWKWGEFPRLFFSSSSRKNASAEKKPSELNEGIYLDDIATNKCLDPSRYLIQVDYNQNQQRIIKDDDQESGTGNSLPHSPVREQEMPYLLGDVQISLCGNQQKLEDMTDELFNIHLVSYEAFAANPSIINDPNLVVRIAGKFYTWDVASLVLTATNIYGKQLPAETIEQLQENTNSPSKTRSSRVGSWWPFSSMKNETNEEYSLSAATEALAFVVKSEVVPTLSKQPDLIQKLSHDSEQEDHEVRKLTERANEEKKRASIHGATGKKMFKRTMTLTSEQLKRLNLNFGMNLVKFSVTNAIQGTTVIEANIFLFDYRTKFVISDIDGTITKSDVFGHILPLVGRDWSHDGIAQLFQAIQENGYQFIYLSARAIGQSRVTRNFLRSVTQCGAALPEGPLLISPDTLFAAFYREIILKKPEEFKINCLKNISSLFPGKNPFYAGFGNRTNDQSAYIAVGIPETRIFTINSSGQVVRDKISQVLSTSYKNLHEVVDQIFPPADYLSAGDSFSSFTFWHKMPEINDSLEQEMRQHLEQMEMSKRSKSKGKLASSPTTTVPLNQLKS